jgi:hypothetical protein
MSGANSGVSSHILPTSATMVGVCMTVVSIVKLTHVSMLGTVIDKILGIDGLLFLASAFLSYSSIRSERLAVRLESLADHAFIIGLTLMGVAATVLAFELL